MHAADALAAYRLTRLVVEDSITDRLSDELTDRALWHKSRVPEPVAELLQCRWCVGVWVGLGVAVARRVAPGPWGVVADGLAYAAVAALAERLES